MSNAMRNRMGPVVSAGRPGDQQPCDESQIRRDRSTAIIVVAVMIALTALIFWLSSLTGTTVHEGVDYWPMMP